MRQAASELDIWRIARRTYEINIISAQQRKQCSVFRFKSIYKKVGVLPISKVKSNLSCVGSSLERNKKRLHLKC